MQRLGASPTSSPRSRRRQRHLYDSQQLPEEDVPDWSPIQRTASRRECSVLGASNTASPLPPPYSSATSEHPRSAATAVHGNTTATVHGTAATDASNASATVILSEDGRFNDLTELQRESKAAGGRPNQSESRTEPAWVILLIYSSNIE